MPELIMLKLKAINPIKRDLSQTMRFNNRKLKSTPRTKPNLISRFNAVEFQTLQCLVTFYNLKENQRGSNLQKSHNFIRIKSHNIHNSLTVVVVKD